MKIHALLITTILILFDYSIVIGNQNISIPLTIHEALREGISGIDRIQEPVTIGIPFPKGMLFERDGVPQLAIEGTQDYQFRTIAKWLDSSVKWALIDFQADVKAEKMNKNIKVISGIGNSPGRLAIDKGEFIHVDTGAMIVQIKKKGFNLFIPQVQF